MPKCTVQITPVVQVHIRGEERRGGRVADDGGLVHRFLGFMTEQKIYNAVRGGYSGGGGYLGYFTAKDAKKIEIWLRGQGVRRRRQR